MRTTREVPTPPAHLSKRSQSLWSDLVPRRARSPERLALLLVALESLDRADAAAAVIEREGMTTTTLTTGAVHLHPLLKLERESRQLFVRTWQTLDLGWDMQSDGR